MNTIPNAPLARYTSLGVGGPAERLYVCTSSDELQAALSATANLWVLGYGANVLIADSGLPGDTVLVRTQTMERQPESNTLLVDAGVWWDDLVQFAISENLWGLELTSGIPGSVGAAVVGNIAAYGQAVSDTLIYIEAYNIATQQTEKLPAADLGLGYRFSAFQTEALKPYIILRAAFSLSDEPRADLQYQSAIDIAEELHFDTQTLAGRRDTILETRKRAGSLWDYRTPDAHMHTAGSFFRNPTVSAELAGQLMAYDETGKTAEMIKKMNQVHGGDSLRVSAAHVLLAAGFSRGQTWGPVRLHPDHILKIENTGGATAQQIYDVAQEIITTVKTKLDIDLVPEVRFLGTFL